MIKSEKEISAIRQACQITDQCFSDIIPFIKPGITELEIAKRMTIDHAFPPIVAFGTNTSFVHHRIPSKYKKCRKQEIILIDMGAKVHGYCSDMTRMVFVGKPKREWVFAYDTLLRVQQTIIHTMKPAPFSGAKMDMYARKMITDAGLPPYPHGLGHNVGREIHELPRLSRKKDAQITPGMVFTIEPGTYLKGDYGVRIEDTVLLSSNGIEILTKSPKTISYL